METRQLVAGIVGGIAGGIVDGVVLDLVYVAATREVSLDSRQDRAATS